MYPQAPRPKSARNGRKKTPPKAAKIDARGIERAQSAREKATGRQRGAERQRSTPEASKERRARERRPQADREARSAKDRRRRHRKSAERERDGHRPQQRRGAPKIDAKGIERAQSAKKSLKAQEGDKNSHPKPRQPTGGQKKTATNAETRRATPKL
jgi:hypothetical protein